MALLVTQLGERRLADISDTEDPFWGSADAPVTAYLFADYQCPYCRRYEFEGGLDHFLATWVETGQVRLVYKDLAFISEDSVAAARASQAVWTLAPDKWSDWNRFIFEHQGGERSGWASHDAILQLTANWGQIPVEDVARVMDADETLAEVSTDKQEAATAGISATPTIVVAGRPHNALDTAAVDSAVRAALAGQP